MNITHRLEPPTTRGGEGFDRRAFTVDDIFRMQESGIIDEDERFELIEGEIVTMQSKNFAHERIKLALNRQLSRTLPDDLQLGVETSLFLSDLTCLEPDLSIFPMPLTHREVRGPDVLLIIEVADTTLRKDRGLKASLYARYEVQELWVIDANRLETHVHLRPVDGRWQSIEVKDEDAVLTHPTAPGFSLRLKDV